MFSGGLKKGDVIGIASPSHIATHEDYDPIFRAIEAMGLGWKAADHLFDADWGYANSDENRAADLNQLICDDQVKMIFFGGGEGGDEIIPLIDYQAAREHPKIWMGFSDGTSVLSHTAPGRADGVLRPVSQQPSGRKRIQSPTVCGAYPSGEARLS